MAGQKLVRLDRLGGLLPFEVALLHLPLRADFRSDLPCKPLYFCGIRSYRILMGLCSEVAQYSRPGTDWRAGDPGIAPKKVCVKSAISEISLFACRRSGFPGDKTHLRRFGRASQQNIFDITR